MSDQTFVVRLGDRTAVVKMGAISVPGVRMSKSSFGKVQVVGGVSGRPGISQLALSFPMDLFIGTGVQPFPVTRNLQILRVSVAVSKDFPPLGDDLVFDILKNNVSITATNKPTVLDGETLGVSIVPDDTTLLAGDVLTVDVLKVGTTQPGSYATLVLEVV